MYDLVIRNGVIVDGSGGPRYKGDVAIKGDRIVAVGTVSGEAAQTIDATGKVVTPGFVDIHTHYDGQASWDPLLAPSSINGVTSIAMGNCGVGFAPVQADKHDWLINLLEGVEDIPGTALAEGLTWDWQSFPDYLDALQRREFAMDVGAHLPHAALRAFVMGERGADPDAAPSPAEIAEMERLTFEALQAGALGFSTSRTYLHRSRDGQNIGTLRAGRDELLAIARAIRRAGRGVIQMISDAYLSADDDFANAELDLIRDLARTSGAPLSFTVQQTDDAPERWRFIFDRVDAMVREGLDVKCQVAPRPIGVILTFASTTNPFLLTPAFRAVAHGVSIEERLKRLADPSVKARILADHAATPSSGLMARLTHGFDRMFRMNDPVDYEPDLSLSLEAEARRLGRDPAEFAYDVFLEEGGRRLIYQPLLNFVKGNLDDVHAMMTGARTLYGLSDGGAHCGTICDGSFPTTTIGLWSKGSKSGKSIPLEQLVHGYSRRNAEQVGWFDRGLVKAGYLADLNVIDMDALALSPPEIIQDLPAGGTRLMQTPRGYACTIKAGKVTFENGRSTGALPGRVLRTEMRIQEAAE
ncbi:N-acyl-D-amino-acid deacylase family protein [Zavarzinia sp. CC-PAN008]|uniref:N-acyl-D-amino-acid deacylase family protein n=1 Tax=Zavarzinia sp. CC-PAN008 TaxID=3243332 RepID=UPI003F74A569